MPILILVSLYGTKMIITYSSYGARLIVSPSRLSKVLNPDDASAVRQLITRVTLK